MVIAIILLQKKSPLKKGRMAKPLTSNNILKSKTSQKSNFGVSIRKIRKSLSPKSKKVSLDSSIQKTKIVKSTTNKENVSPNKTMILKDETFNLTVSNNYQASQMHNNSTFTYKFNQPSLKISNDTFNDSLEEPTNFDDMIDNFKLSPMFSDRKHPNFENIIDNIKLSPTVCDKKNLIFNNSLSPISRGNISLRSQANVSTSTQIGNFDLNYSGHEAKSVIEANLWAEAPTFNVTMTAPLSCIQEETSADSSKANVTFNLSPQYLKRKSECIIETVPVKKTAREPVWEKVNVQKLKRISLQTYKKESSVKLFDPDALLFKVMNPDPFSAAMTEDPFLSTSFYYGDAWMHKQEIEFTKWLNALLTPHPDLLCNNSVVKVDVAKLFAENRNRDVVLAPSKEVASSLYHKNNRLNSLRKKAIIFFHSNQMKEVLSKTMLVVDKKRITIRDDKNVHLDFGLQAQIMELLLCFNPLWLRIGLETIYGETLPLKSNTDVYTLSSFLMTRFFANPFLLQKFGIQNVRRAFYTEYGPAIKKFIVHKFLILIYFLDQSKLAKLIPHDPCLFCVNAPIKESKQLLLEFTKHLLGGVGDITKYLRAANYVLKYKQSSLDEFVYAVKDIGTNLRDGIRLTRVMEIILMRNDLIQLMRVPAISRLQKIHNVKVAMDALSESGFNLVGDINPRDIVEGHREKTLSLLWQIIHKFRAPIFIKAATTIQRCWRSLPFIIKRRILLKRRYQQENNAARFIQRYWKSWLLTKQIRNGYLRDLQAIRKIQIRFRGLLMVKTIRREYLQYMAAVKIVHRYLEAKKVRKILKGKSYITIVGFAVGSDFSTEAL